MRLNLSRVAFTLDTFPSTCTCGGVVRLLRRGRLALLPSRHRRPDGGECSAREAQAAILRTQKALWSVGCGMSERDLARELSAARSTGLTAEPVDSDSSNGGDLRNSGESS